ncbi:nicotinamide N-methyltransferase-like [Lingula anatina]|uniref:Nicotinamide N-methyltransferase-like n=1 Tax=Lingula anatina TaxID=7574 RepID=A0A1S3IL05_LINAN|nr:nicotinamide N-methyltransferase-like [Lingula anatina]|eukprot:XP_013398925.1 nicotinamide N-methyltransferase-like [Lingula anatina]
MANQGYSDKVLRRGVDYKSMFHPQVYLDDYYGPGVPQSAVIKDFLHSLFNTGNINGDRLLDLGSGPVVSNHISAAKWFNELIFSDYAPGNRDALRKWKNNDVDAFDWDPAFKYVAALEGDVTKWEEDRENFRRKMSAIYDCDVHNDNPLHPVTCQPFDCVTSFFCLEETCADEEEFCRVIRNVTSLLREGGVLILLNAVGQSTFKCGDVYFSSLSVEKNDVIKALEKVGLKDISWHSFQAPPMAGLSDSAQCYVVVAKK